MVRRIGRLLATFGIIAAAVTSSVAEATSGGPTWVSPVCTTPDGAIYAWWSKADEGGDAPVLMRLQSGRTADGVRISGEPPPGCVPLEGPVDLRGLHLRFRAVSTSAPKVQPCASNPRVCALPFRVHATVEQRLELRAPGRPAYALPVVVCADSAEAPVVVELFRKKGTEEAVARLTSVSDCTEGGYTIQTVHPVGRITGLRDASPQVASPSVTTLSARLLPVKKIDVLRVASDIAEREGEVAAAAAYLEEWLHGRREENVDAALHVAELYAKAKQDRDALRAIARALSWRTSASDTRARLSRLRALDFLRQDPTFLALLDPQRCCSVVEAEVRDNVITERRLEFEEGEERQSTKRWKNGVLEWSQDREGHSRWHQDVAPYPSHYGVFDCLGALPSREEWNVPLTPTGGFVEGKREGVWRLVAPDGATAMETTYARGVPHGAQRIYRREGSVRVERTLLNGKPHGPELERYPNGTPRGEVTFEEGVQGRSLRCWDPNGVLTLERNAEGVTILPAPREEQDTRATPPDPQPQRQQPHTSLMLSFQLRYDLGVASSYGIAVRMGERARDDRIDLQLGYSAGLSQRLFTRSHGRVDGLSTSLQGELFLGSRAAGPGLEAELGWAYGSGRSLGIASVGALIRYEWLKVGYSFLFPLFSKRPQWLASHQLSVRLSFDVPLTAP